MSTTSTGYQWIPVGTSGYQEDQDQISGATYTSHVVFGSFMLQACGTYTVILFACFLFLIYISQHQPLPVVEKQLTNYSIDLHLKSCLENKISKSTFGCFYTFEWFSRCFCTFLIFFQFRLEVGGQPVFKLFLAEAFKFELAPGRPTLVDKPTGQEGNFGFEQRALVREAGSDLFCNEGCPPDHLGLPKPSLLPNSPTQILHLDI